VPLIGPVLLRYAHYKYAINHTEVTRVALAVAHTHVDDDSKEVLHINHNHFQMVGPLNTDVGANL
jgi:hypothetical protein